MTMIINGHHLRLTHTRQRTHLWIDSAYWGCFMDDLVALMAAAAVINTPVF